MSLWAGVNCMPVDQPGMGEWLSVLVTTLSCSSGSPAWARVSIRCFPGCALPGLWCHHHPSHWGRTCSMAKHSHLLPGAVALASFTVLKTFSK